MRWLVLALVILQSATCGQKGPLILPESEPAQDTFGPGMARQR